MPATAAIPQSPRAPAIAGPYQAHNLPAGTLLRAPRILIQRHRAPADSYTRTLLLSGRISERARARLAVGVTNDARDSISERVRPFCLPIFPFALRIRAINRALERRVSTGPRRGTFRIELERDIALRREVTLSLTPTKSTSNFSAQT